MTDGLAGVTSELDACAASFVKRHRLPGATVGVVHGDSLAWTCGVGFADLPERRASATDHLYFVASVTKTFTGTAVMQLRDAGRLGLDDPAVAHLPELRQADSPFGNIETVTIRRMLSHESGLVSESPGTDLAGSVYQGVARETLQRAEDIGVKVAPNLQWKYSNLAYQLLGEIVTRVSGRPYADYVRKEILEPLGMGSTRFDPLPRDLAGRRATGYAARTFSDELEVAPTMGPVWAEAGLWSSVEDLARWVSFQLGAHGGSGTSPVLAASTLRDMHKPRYLADDGWNVAWGITWFAVRRDDVIWIQHSGGWHGFSSDICFDPVSGVGAIALVNGVVAAEELAMEAAAIARRAVNAAAPVIEPPAPTPEPFRPLLGIYAEAALGSFLRLEWRDGKLTFVDPAAPGSCPTLSPTDDPDVFLIDPGVRQSGETAIFRRRADGRVASVLFASTTHLRLDAVDPCRAGS
ncbi:MAG: serine hydrolase domain-containing protein [Acidimicrobiales bacterium]|jgi:CubicO group peptidase (beta-lactamase class C family)